MSEDKKMTKKEEGILVKDGYPASDEELEQVAGGFLNNFLKKLCPYCHKQITSYNSVCPHCYRDLN